MVVATRERMRIGGLLPDPEPRVGAHGWQGKRVRDDVREGVALVAFSAAMSVTVALLLTLATRLAG